MLDLHFSVDNTELKKISYESYGSIVRGSLNYMRCKFHFSESWKTVGKIAVFVDDKGREHPVKIKNGQCVVANEVTNSFRFEIYVVGINEKQRIQTNRIEIRQSR